LIKFVNLYSKRIMYFVNNLLLTHSFARISLKSTNLLRLRICQNSNLSNHINKFTLNYSSSIASAMRFIQFQRNDNEWKRINGQSLGLLSEDGSQFADFSQPGDLSLPMSFKRLFETPEHLKTVESRLSSLQWEPLDDKISLLPPVTEPEKIICIGLNYLGHCKEQNKEAPKEPMFFSKFASAITGPTGNVILPKITNQLDWEVELAVIIGKEGKHVPKENAFDYVFGYSTAQDISARDWQKLRNGGQFLIGKSMDTFCPLGPAVVHKSLIEDPHNLRVTCSVNGVQKQSGNTNELIFRIDDIIHLLTQSITLKPGDIILTGTPAGVGMHRKPPEFLKNGDIIESEIEKIGKIRNKVVAE